MGRPLLVACAVSVSILVLLMLVALLLPPMVQAGTPLEFGVQTSKSFFAYCRKLPIAYYMLTRDGDILRTVSNTYEAPTKVAQVSGSPGSFRSLVTSKVVSEHHTIWVLSDAHLSSVDTETWEVKQYPRLPEWSDNTTYISHAGNVLVQSRVTKDGDLVIGLVCTRQPGRSVEYARISGVGSGRATHTAVDAYLSNIIITTYEADDASVLIRKHTLLQALPMSSTRPVLCGEPTGANVEDLPSTWTTLDITSPEMIRDDGTMRAAICTSDGIRIATVRHSKFSASPNGIDVRVDMSDRRCGDSELTLGVSGCIIPFEKCTTSDIHANLRATADVLKKRREQWKVWQTPSRVYVSTGGDLGRHLDAQHPSAQRTGRTCIFPRGDKKRKRFDATGNVLAVIPNGVSDTAFAVCKCDGKLFAMEHIDTESPAAHYKVAKNVPGNVVDMAAASDYAAITGDPEIQSLKGEYWRLPNTVTVWRLLQFENTKSPQNPWLIVNASTVVEGSRAYIHRIMISQLTGKGRRAKTVWRWDDPFGTPVMEHNTSRQAVTRKDGEITVMASMKGCALGSAVMRSGFGRTFMCYFFKPSFCARLGFGLLVARRWQARCEITDLHDITPVTSAAQATAP